MPQSERCPRCNIEHVTDAPAGLCPKCLADASDSSIPTRIGDYDIIEELGRGGMGVVYRVKERSTGRVMALKMLLAGEFATPEDHHRFRIEIDAAKGLHHENIVPIYDSGDHEGRPYYTMPVYKGTLKNQLDRYREPTAAAALIAKVASAVQHAHKFTVLHRDLTPANIMIDDQGVPHVGDFGMAKHVGKPGPTKPGESVGTPPYSAPEQVRGDRIVTTAVDVYSLGVILYQLITKQLPFDGDSATVKLAIREAEPVPPRQIAPSVPRDLETICLKCLNKKPEARYRSADDLADELLHFVRGEPIAARPASLAYRAWRFTRRHWLAVGASGGTLLLLAAVAWTALSVAHARELGLQHSAREGNAYAGAFVFHLQQQGDAVVKSAAYMSQLFHDSKDKRTAANTVLNDLKAFNSQFESISFLDISGRMISHVPSVPAILNKDYARRDYFKGGRKLCEEGRQEFYIAHAFQSEADGLYKFGIATPIFDKDGGRINCVGILMATIGTDFALPLKRHQRDHGSDRDPMIVLVAPLDRSQDSTASVGEYIVIKHDGLVHGTGVRIDSPRLREIQQSVKANDEKQLSWNFEPEAIVTDEAYQDPVPGFEGRWRAVYAPLGNTGFVVIVQSRYDAFVELNVWLSRRIVWSVAAVVLAWLVVLGAKRSAYTHRHRRARTPHLDSTPPLPHLPKRISTSPRVTTERNDLALGQPATSSMPSTPRQRKLLRRSTSSSRPSHAGHGRERTSPKSPDGPSGSATG